MTPEGHRILTEKLKHLKQIERPRIIAALEEARGHGDLSENAEYDAAKERQQQLSLQIKDIEHRLSLAHVIDPSRIESDKVVFGATVTLSELDDDEHVTYCIVGTEESDIAKNKISIESPIARALIGKEVGDEVRVTTPRGVREFEIIKIEFC